MFVFDGASLNPITRKTKAPGASEPLDRSRHSVVLCADLHADSCCCLHLLGIDRSFRSRPITITAAAKRELQRKGEHPRRGDTTQRLIFCGSKEEKLLSFCLLRRASSEDSSIQPVQKTALARSWKTGSRQQRDRDSPLRSRSPAIS